MTYWPQDKDHKIQEYPPAKMKYHIFNKNVDIKFSVHKTFLEWPSSDQSINQSINQSIYCEEIVLKYWLVMTQNTD